MISRMMRVQTLPRFAMLDVGPFGMTGHDGVASGEGAAILARALRQ
jgi:hypothetical protein